ncbi:hypothetical protein BG004_004504 [Podila humilis]|nr:hypothetical protein BG004_004504 [Podila humilis]
MPFSTHSHSSYPLVDTDHSEQSVQGSSSSTQDYDDDYDDLADETSDNLSLGSMDTDISPTTLLPPTYDMAAILGNVRPPITHLNSANATATVPSVAKIPRGSSGRGDNNNTLLNNYSNSRGQGTLQYGAPAAQGEPLSTLPTNRIPIHTPSTAEMENLPPDVVALILETLTTAEIYDIHSLSPRWRQLTTRALLDKFRLTHVVLWIDQEGHRAFRPQFIFDSFDEATNRIRWRPHHTAKPESRGQVYNKTFGISKPIIRIVSVGDIDKFDYLDKEAQISIVKPGTRTILGTDKGCPWAMIYKVSSFTRKGKKIDGERWIEPLAFECHLDFLNPKRSHKLRLLWYLQKSYSSIPVVAHADARQAARTKIEGAASESQLSQFMGSAAAGSASSSSSSAPVPPGTGTGSGPGSTSSGTTGASKPGTQMHR